MFSLKSIRETVKALKINRVKKNVFAFFYGTIKKMLKKLYIEFYKPEPKAPAYFVMPFIPAVDTLATREELNELGIF